MNKFLFSCKNIHCGEKADESFSLEYYIIENQTTNQNLNIITYGIEVVKKQEINGIVYSEIKNIPSICSSEQMVIDLVKVISNNTVTPITVAEVILDLLQDEKYKISKLHNEIEEVV